MLKMGKVKKESKPGRMPASPGKTDLVCFSNKLLQDVLIDDVVRI